MYRYSIIIPHRNIPNLLQRCLDSIPQREDIQVIVVDDNSDADKVDFNTFPGLNRKHTEVYLTKEGRGAGYARNVGLEHATGEWLLFADSDDTFFPTIEEVLQRLESTTADLVYFDVQAFNLDKNQETDEAQHFNEIIRKACAEDKNQVRCSAMEVPWCKAVRRSLIEQHQIRFEEVPCSNDTRFSVLCGFYAKEVDVFPIVAYRWITREGSLWRKVDASWCITRLMVCIRLAEFGRQHQRSEIFNRFDGKARFFLEKLHPISLSQYIRYMAVYGFRLRHPKAFTSKIPSAIGEYFHHKKS